MEERAEAIDGKTGGCEVGRNSWFAKEWTWPFAGLYIYRDQLVLSMSFHRLRFASNGDFSDTQISQRGVTRAKDRAYRFGLSAIHAVLPFGRRGVWRLAANAFPVATPLSR